MVGVKRCSVCKKVKPLEEFHRNKRNPDGRKYICKKCRKIRQKEWRKNNPEMYRARKKRYREKHKDQMTKWTKEWRRKHPKKCKNYSKKWRKKLKLEVLIHYGGNPPKCSRCETGDIRVLEIDHIGGGGNKHRQNVTGNFYVWLRDNNFPKGFRVLCRNCNWIEKLEN